MFPYDYDNIEPLDIQFDDNFLASLKLFEVISELLVNLGILDYQTLLDKDVDYIVKVMQSNIQNKFQETFQNIESVISSTNISSNTQTESVLPEKEDTDTIEESFIYEKANVKVLDPFGVSKDIEGLL